MKYLAFFLAVVFVGIWIAWAVIRSRQQKDGTEELPSSKRTLAILEGIALMDVIGFAFTVYPLL